MILGTKENRFHKDDYVIAALILYIDIIKLLIQILKALTKKKKK